MSITEITAKQLAAKLAAGEAVFLLDVRQPDEHEFAAIPNSKHIPLGELPVRMSEIDPPDGALIVVYCHHGMRSLNGAAFLQQANVGPVASLEGGIDSWSSQVDPAIRRY